MKRQPRFKLSFAQNKITIQTFEYDQVFGIETDGEVMLDRKGVTRLRDLCAVWLSRGSVENEQGD